MSYVKVLESNVAYEGKYQVIREKLEYAAGRTTYHETVTHPGAVVILPIAEDGTLLLVSQYRHSVKRELLEFPAGTLELNEAPEPCAARELAEEIGFGARMWVELGELLPAPGFCNEKQHLFLARDLFPQRAEADVDEIIAVKAMSIESVESAIASGDLMDAKSIAIFARARARGLI